jgi:hypothetical protein
VAVTSDPELRRADASAELTDIQLGLGVPADVEQPAAAITAASNRTTRTRAPPSTRACGPDARRCTPVSSRMRKRSRADTIRVKVRGGPREVEARRVSA